jgi:hypothetical protein
MWRCGDYCGDVRDIDVRRVLHDRLAAEHKYEPDTLLIPELGLCGMVRIDMAVVNGSLAGYEIKSARDTLRRLPTQVEVYSQVLDFAHLVVAGKHYDQALPWLPDWWGVHVATMDGDVVTIETVRQAGQNTEFLKMSLAQLLWRDEALDELEQRGLDRGVRTKARWHVWTRLADTLSVDELRQAVRSRLKARQGWRDGLSPGPGGAR